MTPYYQPINKVKHLIFKNRSRFDGANFAYRLIPQLFERFVLENRFHGKYSGVHRNGFTNPKKESPTYQWLLLRESNEWHESFDSIQYNMPQLD